MLLDAFRKPEGRIRVLDQLERHLREPGAGGRIHHVADRVDAAHGVPAIARAVRLDWGLDPQVRSDQRVAGVGGRGKSEAAIRRVAPILANLLAVGGRVPRADRVAARVDYELDRPPRVADGLLIAAVYSGSVAERVGPRGVPLAL